MGVSLNVNAMSRWRARLRNIASKARRGDLVSKQMAEEAVDLVKSCFDLSTSPSGQVWPSLKYRTGRPLLDTGRLRNSITRRVTTTGFKVFTNVIYAAVHNYGAVITPVRAKALSFVLPGIGRVFAKRVKIPRRQFLPASGRLPTVWKRALEAIARAELRRQMGA